MYSQSAQELCIALPLYACVIIIMVIPCQFLIYNSTVSCNVISKSYMRMRTLN